MCDFSVSMSVFGVGGGVDWGVVRSVFTAQKRMLLCRDKLSSATQG